MVPAHVTSGSVLIYAWPTPIISAYHLVYSSIQMSVPANPPLAPPSISNLMESEMVGDMGHINSVSMYKVVTTVNINRLCVASSTA